MRVNYLKEIKILEKLLNETVDPLVIVISHDQDYTTVTETKRNGSVMKKYENESDYQMPPNFNGTLIIDNIVE